MNPLPLLTIFYKAMIYFTHTKKSKNRQSALSDKEINELLENLKKLSKKLKKTSQNKFISARQYKNASYEKRFIEHGAICYANAHWDLEEVINHLFKK